MRPDGDPDELDIYVAVGRTLTKWECIEESLSGLYTLLIGAPGCLETYRQYGVDEKTFAYRSRAICDAAKNYFVSRPNQDDEGEVIRLVDRAAKMSVKRNRIAHGKVTSVKHFTLGDEGAYLDPVVRYHLGHPWFSGAQHNDRFPGLGSKEINLTISELEELEADIEDFVNRLLPSNYGHR